MSGFFSSALDTIKGYGLDIGEAATAGLKGAADATVAAAVDTLKNAGTPQSAIAETHHAVQRGENADGSTVLALPSNKSVGAGGQIVTAGGVAVPVWVWYLLGGSMALIVGGVVYKVVVK